MAKKLKLYTDFLGRFEEATKAEIKAVLENDEPLTIKGIATRTGNSYVTTKKRLDELIAEDRVKSHEIDGKTRVFFVKREREQ